jgi:hypothetical protein
LHGTPTCIGAKATSFWDRACNTRSHSVPTHYQSNLHRFFYQTTVRVEENRQVASIQLLQELLEPLGGTLIEFALRRNPLTARLSAGVWLARSDNKDHWLTSDFREQSLKLCWVAARSDANCGQAEKPHRHVGQQFAKHWHWRLASWDD